jgi:metalloendopeptidase OMA1, mitochondrial
MQPIKKSQVRNRPLSAIAATFMVWALLLGLTAGGCSTVPVTGRKTFNIIPDSQAMALGADSYKQILDTSKLITGGPQYESVVRVGRRIAAVSDAPNLQWEFNLIDDPKTVNAFCLPGGKVAVYTGILPITRDDTGLAVVVAHEIGHAIAKHGSERMTDQLAFQVGQIGLDALLQQKSEGSRNLILAAYGAGGTLGVLLPFSRNQESEADHIGLIYMARAGYDPRQAPEFWRRMEASAAGQSKPPEFLSTHPASETRVRQLEEWMPEALKEYRPR